MRRYLYWKTAQLAIDAALGTLALLTAYVVRFEGHIPAPSLKQMVVVLPYLLVARLCVNGVFGIYKIAWRYISLHDVTRFGLTASLPTLMLFVIRVAVPQWTAVAGLYIDVFRLPLSIIAIEGMLFFLGSVSARVTRRIVADAGHRAKNSRPGASVPAILIGAGRAGVIVAREVRSRPDIGMHVVGFIDDDPGKRGQSIDGVPVLGTTPDLPALVKQHRIDRVVITIANISGGDMRRIMSVCETIPIRPQVIPGIYELVEGTVSVSRLRDVELEDLLGRTPVDLDTEAVAGFLRGSRIVVTGAGGSIGSEMCRQVCRFGPSSLILVERYENNLFEIDRELRMAHPALRIVPCVADITDEARMETIFKAHEPQVIIHAAAHKHVPMMEANPTEAVQNNILGTRLLANMADRHGAAVFVMISTDKAVRPKSVMGASKRLAELYVQSLAQQSATRFTTVRFGNVLGSAGSVIPIFKKQIAAGGPITVTHPEMKRYFMTIPEAAQLVLQAASMGAGGEIYVLDMGEPVKIVSLAEELVRLSGLKPYEDIEIVFTGIRPGEKLFEELSLHDENLAKTQHAKIFVGKNKSFSKEDVFEKIRGCEGLLAEAGQSAIRAALIDMVTEDTTALPAAVLPDNRDSHKSGEKPKLLH